MSMTLSVLPRVELDLNVTHPQEGSSELGQFLVVGPEKSVSMLLQAVPGRSFSGSLSPLCRVTVPKEARASAVIPLDAAFFAFAYPLPNLEAGLKKLDLANDPWAFFLLLDEPEVYGLPPDPVVTTRDLGSMWRHVGAGALALAGLGAASFLGRRR